MSAVSPRRYRGITGEERRAERHEKLLDAGLQLFGERGGYAQTTIRDVCVAAGLNQRYFYESFAGREELLVAVYDRVVAELARALLVASEFEGVQDKVSSGLAAWWEVLTTDSHKARLVCVEGVHASKRMGQRHRYARGMITAFMVAQLRAVPGYPGGWSDDELELHAHWLVAGTVGLMTQWLNGDLDRSVDELVQECSERFLLVARHVLEGPPVAATATAASAPAPRQGSRPTAAPKDRVTVRARSGAVRRPRAKPAAGKTVRGPR